MTSDTTQFWWPTGSASGAGSMPGTDPARAIRTVFDELPDLPHLAELPSRGPGADMIGRTAGLLADLPAETSAGRWRLTQRPGRDLRRARDLLAADLDELEEAAEGYEGPLKIQVCGPWTLAASVELPFSQDVALVDHGAVADLIASLAEGVTGHVADVRKRVPGARLLLQLDEPMLTGVLDGAVPTASGWRRLAAVEADVATEGLRAVLGAVRASGAAQAAGAARASDAGQASVAGQAYGIVHCCADRVPFGMIMKSGARGIWLDLSQLRRGDEDGLAEAIEVGAGIFAGVAQALDPRPPDPRAMAAQVTGLLHRLGLLTARSADQVVIGPACGLGGASPERAVAVLAACREAGRILPEMIEEGSA